ncbi:MAG: protease complex subunit PrcB family protein [Lachnospiraceae bacterium]|nr:protease complex subunit PrcB family protein [Lachnospiraceae bacterium]
MKQFIHICMAVFIIGACCIFIKRYMSGDTEYREVISDEGEKVDLDFTVCEEGRLPAELVEIINEKKASPFKLTFTTREYMYIVVGYGAQQRGGCAVTVNALYRTSQAVYIDTNLIGSEGETIKIDGITYPYVAVKCENQNLPVVYE